MGLVHLENIDMLLSQRCLTANVAQALGMGTETEYRDPGDILEPLGSSCPPQPILILF
jgi:hypothetical protein